MKGIPYSLIKKQQLKSLLSEVSLKNTTISSATEFVKEIGRGNLDVNYKINEAHIDALSSSLVSMRDQMKKIAAEEKQRNWATEGLASFAEILRTRGNSFSELSDSIIKHLVNYVGANQGALYLVNDEDSKDVFIEMVACFAYNRKKHLSHRINLGDGTIGQVVLEKSTTYMKNIPKDYIKITSGLGEALPANVLIVPLKLDDTVFGVVELAAFETIQPYRIEFVEKVGQSIASTISAVKIAERTQHLLQESQQQAEEMKSQEEEMRQNMEELSATQEEMHRVLKEVQVKEGYLNELINASEDLIYTVDKEYKLVSWNKAFAKTLEQFKMTLEKGSTTLDWYTGDEKAKQRDLYNRAFAGQTFGLSTQADNQGTMVHFINTYAPLHNALGEIFSVAIFGKNVTEMVNARHAAEVLMKDAQNQTEELKSQGEELRQNMEELSATQEEMQRILTEVQDQERYMKDMIDSSKDSILTVDKNYKVVSFNKALVSSYSSLGITIEKGFEMRNIFNEEEWPKFRGHYDRALQGESFEVTEHYHSHGFDSYFVINYSPLCNEKGDVIAAAVFAKDTTELMRANQEAKDQQLYFHDVIEGMSDCVLTIDANYTIVVANSAFKKVFSGYGLDVAPGASLLAMAQGDKKKEEEFKRPYVRAFAGEHVEEPHRHHFDRDFQVSYNPLKNTAGEIIGVSLIAHDITHRMRLQQETERLLNDSQVQSEELKAQQEEIHQNMEELAATQDEMQRVLTLVQNKEAYLNTIINAYTDTILTVDKSLKITLFNKYLADTFAAQGVHVTLGMDVLALSHPDQAKESKNTYLKAFAGEKTVQNQEYFGRFYEITTHPLIDAEGITIGAGVFTKDITTSTQLLHESQQRLEEVRSQEEELRQNMEEMQAIQDELARKSDALERVRQIERERADAQINAQKKIMSTVMEKFATAESEYKARIAALEKQLKEQA